MSEKLDWEGLSRALLDPRNRERIVKLLALYIDARDKARRAHATAQATLQSMTECVERYPTQTVREQLATAEGMVAYTTNRVAEAEETVDRLEQLMRETGIPGELLA